MTAMPPDLTQSIWTALPVPAIITDADHQITQVNGAAETFLNASSRGLRGHAVWDKLPSDVPLEAAILRMRTTLAPVSLYDVTVGSGARTPVVCDIQIAPVTEDPGHTLILVLPREIADRLGQGRTAKTAAKSAIGMAEMLAHEIKNPLAGIMGAAQLIGMNVGPEDLELTNLIVAESRRIVKLLEQVEQFGNLRAPVCNAVNIHDVLDRARKSAMVGFGAHCTFVERYDPSLPATLADADQLQQVFQNLLRNASEACKGGGTITLRTYYEQSLRVRRADGSGAAVPLQVEVIDDGAGIAPEIAANIFEPFVSGRKNGTGLGLALVSKIVADHDGWITVTSSPGRTVFRVSLPVAPKRSDPGPRS
jgi:two-component system nitrogen regulation sensor histidine kinase GlnL